MRVVSVPGRTVRHPVTRRVIDERGVLYDPHDVTIAQLINHGDLALAEDLPAEDAGAAGAPEAAADPIPPAGPDADATEQE